MHSDMYINILFIVLGLAASVSVTLIARYGIPERNESRKDVPPFVDLPTLNKIICITGTTVSGIIGIYGIFVIISISEIYIMSRKFLF